MCSIWLPVTSAFYYKMHQAAWAWPVRVIVYVVWFYVWDAPVIAFALCAFFTERLLRRTQCSNRLFSTGKPMQFLGPRIVILGNGPSLCTGKQNGEVIDSMDEVIRFNNFQTKAAGLEAWTGSKTTVHFSDSMLYP